MHTLRVISLAAMATSTAAAANFFPLQQGNTWTYRSVRTGAIFTVDVGLPALINNRVYYTLRGYGSRPLLVRLDERRNLVQVDQENGYEQVVTSFEPFEHGWWEAPARGCPQDGQTLERRELHDGAAGPIDDALQIDYRIFACMDTGITSEQYAENIGMVRRVVTTIAGPDQYDLVYARAGKMQINALPNASFNVSILDSNQKDYVEAVLRLRTNSPLALNLRFPAGQEFEVAVRDEVGRTIWKWSDGQFFTAAEHQRLVWGEWPITVRIPRTALAPRGSEPALYTIQAWLMTAGADPQFAATVPISVAPDWQQ
jgi:hypothetical protein